MPHPWRKLERNKDIYFKHEYLNYTMTDLAQEYDISVSRAQQIVRNVEYQRAKRNPDYYFREAEF